MNTGVFIILNRLVLILNRLVLVGCVSYFVFALMEESLFVLDGGILSFVLKNRTALSEQGSIGLHLY